MRKEILLLLFPFVFSLNISFIFNNGTVVKYLLYDNKSQSYADNTIRNPNILLNICGINSSYIGEFVDVVYYSESGNITIPLTSLKPQIYNVSENCSIVDVDLSVFESLYPGKAGVLFNNSLERDMLTFNGSYLVGVDVDFIENRIRLIVLKVYDDLGGEINATKSNLIFSIISNGIPVKEGIGRPGKYVVFDYMFKTGDKVIINGIEALKVKVVPPCTIINETGYYYIINESAWNRDSECLIIDNVSNIVVDFGNHTIDGDGNLSYSEGVCGVIVRNVENITLKDVRVQEFNRGVCIINSRNVKIFGSSGQVNYRGIYLVNSSAKISRIKMDNLYSEIVGKNNSLLGLDLVYFATANLSLKGRDLEIKNVKNPPPDPQNYTNMSQWIMLENTSLDSWAYRVSFKFEDPSKTYVLPKFIGKYNGSFVNGSWIGNWIKMETGIDMVNFEIYLPMNLTNFSIFAPFGTKIPPKPKPVPKPVPTPTPTPAPSAVPGAVTAAVPPKVNITILNETVEAQQGQVFRVVFNVTNYGDSDVNGILVVPEVRKGWTAHSYRIESLPAGESFIGELFITVYENEIPGEYWVPVRVILEETGATLDVDIFKVIVLPRKRLHRITILEAVPYLVLPEKSMVPLSFLIMNTGDYDLHNIRLKIVGGEGCVKRIIGSYDMKVGEKRSLVYNIYTSEAGRRCAGAYVFESDEGVVGVYPVIIEIVKKKPPIKIRISPIYLVVVFYIFWTVLTIWTICREIRRKRSKLGR